MYIYMYTPTYNVRVVLRHRPKQCFVSSVHFRCRDSHFWLMHMKTVTLATRLLFEYIGLSGTLVSQGIRPVVFPQISLYF